jgi:hypothetical protein
MRHKNVSTTLRIYTQVRSEEIEASVPSRSITQELGQESMKIQVGNVIHYEFGAIS